MNETKKTDLKSYEAPETKSEGIFFAFQNAGSQ